MGFISVALTIWHFNRKKGVRENTNSEFPGKLPSHLPTGLNSGAENASDFAVKACVPRLFKRAVSMRKDEMLVNSLVHKVPISLLRIQSEFQLLGRTEVAGGTQHPIQPRLCV